jgi:3D (Asp-Asp-Asp) domain-containing protein
MMQQRLCLLRARGLTRCWVGGAIVLGALLAGWTLALATPDPGAAAGVTVTLHVNAADRRVTSQAVCVAELIASQNIALGPQDEVSTDLDAALTEGMVVTVKRMTTQIVQRRIEVPPPAATRVDRRVARPVVLNPGRPGVADAVVEVTLCDGAEVGQRVISRKLVRGPEPKIVIVGSGRLPSRGGVLMMEATGYDPGPRSCGRYSSGCTAIGMRAGKGVVAVDPRVIPLGTRLYIEGYGAAVAGDVGSAIKGRRIDLGFGTFSEAMRWGRRTVRVQIIE